MELIERYVPRQIDVPVLMVTAFADVQMAVRAVKTGVVNVLEKPLRGDELLEAVQKILASQEGRDFSRKVGSELMQRRTGEMRKYQMAQIETLARVAAAAGMKPE